MKKFFVKLSNKQKHLFSQELLVGHVKHLKHLTEIGVLQTCGPCDDGSAILIIKADNIEMTRNYVEEDPFICAGFYKSVEITEFFEATMENNFFLSE